MSAVTARRSLRETPAAGDGPANDDSLQSRSLLRFITCGSVDDGKSTLIGRILFETGAIFDDQLGALQRDSRKFGTQGGALDLALLVDGLSAEREQGITIDVAYRYFATPRRAFIVADTPGHEQYTRNMATGASTADLAIILVDARLGLLPQTRRHSFIVSLVGVRHVVVAVNKMDLVGYDRAVFERIAADYRQAAAGLGFSHITVIPLSARDGDNVAVTSPAMGWYDGPPLLAHLEAVALEAPTKSHRGAVLPVQWVNRPDSEFRGYSGNLAHGEFTVGDRVAILPSGRTTTVARILTPAGEARHGQAGQALTVTLADEVDVSRGDLIVHADDAPPLSRSLSARLLWTAETAMEPGRRYQLKLASTQCGAVIGRLHHRIDVASYAEVPAATLAMNDIGAVTLDLDQPIGALPYGESLVLGGFILIDPVSRETVAFGFVGESREHRSAASPATTLGVAAALRARLAAWAGEPGTLRRSERAGLLAGHLVGTALLAGLVLAWTGSAGAAALVAGADFVLRPLAVSAGRRFGGFVWRQRLAKRGAAEENLLGDGI